MPTNPPQPERLHQGKFLSLMRLGHWEYAHRETTTGAIVVVAVTPEDKLLLVEQHRPPIGANAIELPAGLVGDEPDEADEGIEQAARRELEEETGFQAKALSVLSVGPSSAGLTSEMITIFHATGLERVSQGGGVANENIIVHEVPLTEVAGFLAAQVKAGKPVDAKVYAGLYFLNRNETSGRQPG